MEDYKALYLKLFGEVERAIEVLVAAQQECEEMFLAQGEEEE